MKRERKTQGMGKTSLRPLLNAFSTGHVRRLQSVQVVDRTLRREEEKKRRGEKGRG